MTDAGTIVVAALSARTLAESARRGGWRVVALDLYGDRDTRAASTRWLPIGDPARGRVDGPRLRAALALAAREPAVAGWIAGSGFDDPAGGLLDAGGEALPRLGPPTATVAAVRTPATFFSTLDRRRVAYPEVRLAPPPDPKGWLCKHAGGSGGWHIARAAPSRPDVHTYWQREHAGVPMSALFLADGRRACIVGFSRLLVRPLGARPYVYHGAIGPVDAPALRARVAATLDALVPTFALRGLASLDFLADDDRPLPLEINPRPSDTLALYDALWPHGLLRAHVDALHGRLPAAVPPPDGVRGHEIVYAATGGRIDAATAQRLADDPHVHDVPVGAATFDAAMPVCTVAAHAGDEDAVRRELARRAGAVAAALQPLEETP